MLSLISVSESPVKYTLASTLLLIIVLSGCELSSTLDEDNVVGGVNLTELFAEPTNSEIQSVLAEWSGRQPRAEDVVVEMTRAIFLNGMPSTVRIVSHTVQGVKHFGAVVSADNLDPDSAPILVYAHGGDSGVSVDNEFLLLISVFADLSDKFVFVIPSFRDEPLAYAGNVWQSEGPASPWDWDVDDAMSLVEVAFQIEPGANSNRIAVLGFSRGAGVGMLMASRSQSIDAVLDFFGPTDFFGPFVQEVVSESLEGNLRDLPGIDYLTAEFTVPYQQGSLSLEDIRLELVRRSPTLFANRISKLQIHHGTADQTVPVSQAERMISAMQAAGHTDDTFQAFLYEGGEHNPFTLEGSIERARIFLEDFLADS